MDGQLNTWNSGSQNGLFIRTTEGLLKMLEHRGNEISEVRRAVATSMHKV